MSYIKIFIVVIIILVILWIIYLKNKKTALKNITSSLQEEDLDNRSFPIRQLYRNYNFPFAFIQNDIITYPTGKGQTVGVIANMLSCWYVEDILRCLFLDNRIENKTIAQLQRQITHVDCTEIEEPFTLGEYENLTIPLSNGIESQIPLTDPLVKSHSVVLSVQLQNILAIAPDTNIIIFYFGTVPVDCEDDDSCPSVEDYRQVVARLYDHLFSDSPGLQIICNAISFEAEGEADDDDSEQDDDPETTTLNEILRTDVAAMVHEENVTFLSSTGDDGRDVETLPQIIADVITVGGTERLFNGTEQAYKKTNGGMYDQSRDMPSRQVGVIPFPRHLDSPWDVTKDYIGRPDIGGCSTNLSYYFNKNVTPIKNHEGTEIAVAVYSGLLSLVNELTQHQKWNYLDIFYRESTYLFKYVNKGTNLMYDASHFKNWNPLCGLGRINGEILCNFLIDKYVFSNKRIQVFNPKIQAQLSYINFYPLSPLTDPINLLPRDDYYHSQPVFGPTCLWSELTILKVDPVTNKIKIESEPLNHNDVIIILCDQKFSKQLVLKYISPIQTIEIAEYHIDNADAPIDPSFLWVLKIDKIDENPGPLLLYNGFRLKPRLNQRLYLSCKFDDDGDGDYPNLSSPSLVPATKTNATSEYTCFKCSIHPYSIMNSNYRDTSTIESSYFINITNQNSFITSGFDYSDRSSSMTNYLIGRLRSSMLPYNLPRPVYRDFDGFSEWLFIPIHQPSPDELYPSLNLSLTSQNNYIVYNVRLQAYLYVLDYELRLLNINKNSCSESDDVYNRLLFSIHSESSDIFSPTSYPTSPFKVNPFLSKISLYQRPAFYTDKIPEHQYQLFRLTNAPQEGTHGPFVQFNAVTLPSPPNLYLFWVNPRFMCTTYENVLMSPAFPFNGNNRFIGTCISYCDNDILCMKPLNKDDFKQQWTILGTRNVIPIQSNSFPINYMMYSGTSQFTLENHFQADSYIGYPDGNGWIPRIHVGKDNREWSLHPNYENVITSQIPNTLSLANNYLYLYTFYNIDCPKGVMSCCLNGSHVPGLIRQDIENEDNIIYGSQLYMFK